MLNASLWHFQESEHLRLSVRAMHSRSGSLWPAGSMTLIAKKRKQRLDAALL